MKGSVNTTEVRRLIWLATSRTGQPVFDEDLAQEAVARACAAFERVGNVEHPNAFLTKIVFDTVKDHWRRRRVADDSIESVDERRLCYRPEFEADLDRNRRTELLRKAVACLEPEKRELLHLFYDEEMSATEIARRFEVGVSAVKMRLVRARQELADLLGNMKNGKRPSPAD